MLLYLRVLVCHRLIHFLAEVEDIIHHQEEKETIAVVQPGRDEGGCVTMTTVTRLLPPGCQLMGALHQRR